MNAIGKSVAITIGALMLFWSGLVINQIRQIDLLDPNDDVYDACRSEFIQEQPNCFSEGVAECLAAIEENCRPSWAVWMKYERVRETGLVGRRSR